MTISERLREEADRTWEGAAGVIRSTPSSMPLQTPPR